MTNTAGRPPKYETPEQMQRLIDLYFLACRVHQTEKAELLEELPIEDLEIVNDIECIYPTISGLAYTLDMTTEGLRNYGTKDDFSATVKRAKQRVEMSLEQRLAGNAVTGSIFSLKNNFGWKDKTEVDNTHKFNDLSDDQLEERIKQLTKND
jgi:hypothetical protein